ncbi:MAG: hypothetical protein RL642_1192 [Bacteroidota bacterium]
MKHFLIFSLAALLLVSCKNQSTSSWQKLTFIQGKPALVHLNLGDTSQTHGDGMAFEAPLKDTSGAEVGEIMGWLVTVDIDIADSSNPVHLTERIGTTVFNFGDENEIVAQGGISYHHGEQLMKIGIEQKRAIVGGTGKYKGIVGEVTTTRNDDGTYTHFLDYKIDN